MKFHEFQFRRVETLPPYVFAQINELKRELRHDGTRRGRPRLRQPRHPVARRSPSRSSREAALRPVNHRYSVSRGLPQLRAALAELYAAPLRRHARPRHAGRRDDRREGGAVAPDVGAGRAGRRGDRPLSELPDPSVRARFAGATTVEAQLTPSFADAVLEAYERTLPAPAGRDPVVPAQPDHGDGDPRGPAAARRLRARAQRAARPRLRLRGHRLRRLPPALAARDPRRARLQRRAVQPDEVVLDGRLARRLRRRARRRRRRAREAEVLPRLRHLPADPDRLDRRACGRLPTTPTR